MKIIILGAGQVGGTLAEHLADEKNDITVVDTDVDRLRALKDSLDIRTVAGNASIETDAADNWKPSKKKSTERIDGIVALIMALDRATTQSPFASVYDTRGLLSL